LANINDMMIISGEFFTILYVKRFLYMYMYMSTMQ